MTIDEIREIIHVFNDSGIAELEVQRGDSRVRLRRGSYGAAREYVLPPMGSMGGQVGQATPGTLQMTSPAPPMPAAQISLPAPPPVAAPSAPLAASAAAAAAAAPAAGPEAYKVTSPIVGTYYDAPSPGSAPFVKIGDTVKLGQVLCIIESMKLMNEIEAEVSGTLVSKMVENGRPVEYGEVLFAVHPS